MSVYKWGSLVGSLEGIGVGREKQGTELIRCFIMGGEFGGVDGTTPVFEVGIVDGTTLVTGTGDNRAM